ncbi:MAG: HPr family phosphocarrier protein [Nocardioidaceae bacterium]
MASQTARVGSRVGLHARPAAAIASAVTTAGVPVTIGVAGGDPVDAGSALLLMTLGAKQGDQVNVTSDDDAVLAEIVRLVEADLDG